MKEKEALGVENDKATQSISIIRQLLNDDEFKNRHRTNSKFFTRLSKLSFVLVIIIVLQRSVKSYQLMLNEFFKKLGNGVLVTDSAFTQARYKLQPQAFIELHRKGVIEVMYANGDHKTFWGFRILSVDGSKVQLPNSPSIWQEFGTINISNGKGVIYKYGYGLVSTIYDVLNKIVIDATIAPAKAYEVDLSIEHLEHTVPGDMILGDRNYSSYRHLAAITKANREFTIRCSRASFAAAREIFEQDIVTSRVVTLTPQPDVKKQIQAEGLAEQIKVRFVSVRLDTGELEVLVTSLLDEEKYSTEGFKELYHMRWGIEGYYGLLKERLNIENFSGKTALSVKQDFYATIFITGLESILTQEADLELAKKSEENALGQTVNNMVSFNGIKNHVIELFFDQSKPIELLLETLTGWFMMNPTYTNREREVPRKKSSPRVSLNYNKRKRKLCF